MNRAAHYKYLISQMKDGDPNKVVLQYQLIKEEKKLKKAKKEHLHSSDNTHFKKLSETIQNEVDNKNLTESTDEPLDDITVEEVKVDEIKIKKTRQRKKK